MSGIYPQLRWPFEAVGDSCQATCRPDIVCLAWCVAHGSASPRIEGAVGLMTWFLLSAHWCYANTCSRILTLVDINVHTHIYIIYYIILIFDIWCIMILEYNCHSSAMDILGGKVKGNPECIKTWRFGIAALLLEEIWKYWGTLVCSFLFHVDPSSRGRTSICIASVDRSPQYFMLPFTL